MLILAHTHFQLLISLETTLSLTHSDCCTHSSSPDQPQHPPHCITETRMHLHLRRHPPIAYAHPSASHPIPKPQARARAKAQERRRREATRRKYIEMPRKVGRVEGDLKVIGLFMLLCCVITLRMYYYINKYMPVYILNSGFCVGYPCTSTCHVKMM